MGHAHELPYEDEHVQFPDVRIEYEDRDGRRDIEDVEIVTPITAARTPRRRGGRASSNTDLAAFEMGGRSGRRTRPAVRSARGGGDPVMTDAERVDAVAKLGFTPRQAGFLVTVAMHAGVCLARQYAHVCRACLGPEDVRDFFAMLVKRRFATALPVRPPGREPVPRPEQDPLSRDRRTGQPPPPADALARAVERLMVLDAVLADPESYWLATERDKLAHFRACTAFRTTDMPG